MHSVSVLSSSFLLSPLNPVRPPSRQACPDQGDPGGKQHERETIGRARLPREIVQQERGARCRKDGAGRHGGSPVQNEPQEHSTNATREGHTGLLQKADCRLEGQLRIAD